LIERINLLLGKVAATRCSNRLTARDLVVQIGILVWKGLAEEATPTATASRKTRPAGRTGLAGWSTDLRRPISTVHNRRSTYARGTPRGWKRGRNPR
jgi:hypothetical protein